jgi:hypothetical protein
MKMLQPSWRHVSFAIATCLTLAAAAAWAGSSRQQQPNLHSSIPAGYEVIQLQPSGAQLSLLGLIECPDIEGAQRRSEGLGANIVSAGGTLLRRFPRHFSYRVTASLRKTVIDPPDATIVSAEDPDELLLGLKFRLRDYDGLAAQEVVPEAITMIGVPADIPYDERVYRVSFDVGDRPVTDRFVLEVYSSGGERLSRFHFELL